MELKFEHYYYYYYLWLQTWNKKLFSNMNLHSEALYALINESNDLKF